MKAMIVSSKNKIDRNNKKPVRKNPLIQEYITLINSSTLFDEGFYSEQNPPVKDSGMEPIEHFVCHGWKEGRDPSPNFCVNYYLKKYKDVKEAELNPLIHYISFGQKEGRFISQNEEDIDLIKSSLYFDEHFYAQKNPDVKEYGLDPLEHFVNYGWREGRDPSPDFSVSYYLKKYKDVKEAGINPLIHYIAYGRDKGRLISQNEEDRALIKSSSYFDEHFYAKQNPDVKYSGLDLYEHFICHGWREGRDPSADFSIHYYLTRYKDIKKAGVNPLVHYISSGLKEGRYTSQIEEHIALIKSSKYFDEHFYAEQNRDLKISGPELLRHFVCNGWLEDRDPSPNFSIRFYLQRYKDVEESGVNPLVHYISQGHNEGRFPSQIAVKPSSKYIDISRYLPKNNLKKDALIDLIQLEVLYQIGKCSHDLVTSCYISDELSFKVHESPTISIIIPIHNHIDYTLKCLYSLKNNVPPDIPFEIIVIDDFSSDGSADILSKINGLTVVRNKQNLGFVDSCNKGISCSKGRYLVFLNNDTIVLPGWLENLLKTFQELPNVGLVGSMLLYPSGRLQEAGGIVWEDGSGGNYGNNDYPLQSKYLFARDVDYCSGASIMIERKIFNKAGGFDEIYSPGYYEDTDLAFMVRKLGFRTIYQPLSRVIHFEGITAGTNQESGMKQFQAINKKKFVHRWNHIISGFGNHLDPPPSYQERSVEKRVLVIDKCTPTPDQDSGSNDTIIHMNFLQQAGFQVTFAAANMLHFGKYTDNLQRRGIECIYRPDYSDIDHYLKQNGSRYDLVWIYRCPILENHLDAVRKHCPQAKLVFDTVDLHHIRLQREADLLGDQKLLKESQMVKTKELELIQHADTAIVISEEEKEYLRSHSQTDNITVLPMCRDFPGRKNGFQERQPNIVFIGGFEHAPNVDAVVNFVDTVWPRIHESAPHVNFLIVGSKANRFLPKIDAPGVHVVGFVEDITEILENCLITVAPLRFGAGIKGKLLTSLGHGVPVVLSRIAIEGTNFIAGKHCLLADDPTEYHSAILDVLSNKKKWEHLSEEGLKFVRSAYSAGNVQDKFNQIISNLGFSHP